LLYHHATDGDPPNIYSISADTVSEQVDYLQVEGYTAIPISLLVKAIQECADLPDRPVVITFNDGNLDVYENAYPIMQEFGFSRTLYLVMNYLDHNTLLSSEQAAEMVNAGWEIGSHRMSHPDLYGMQTAISYQVVNSKKGLVEAIGTPVNTFAYPYRQTNGSITTEVKKGYPAAVGLGKSSSHSPADIYYLARIDVRNDMDITTFANALSW
jgi:peptidoglycan/xylan/chitin deacetylase (PgdA/CDA1 family)